MSICLGGAAHVDMPPENNRSRTDVSLITGRIRHLGTVENEQCEIGSRTVMKRDEKMFAISNITTGGEIRCCVTDLFSQEVR